MSSSLAAIIKARLIELIHEKYGLSLDNLAAEVPPKTELGDLAFPVAFELAKQLKAATGQKHNPREIAALLSSKLSELQGVARVEVAGAGYLNLFFNRGQIFRNFVTSADTASTPSNDRGKMIVEHTSINPNKAAHIGHVRNAVLGDTIVRILRATGDEIEIHNYIDNTGVQVADVVVGFIHLEGKSINEVKSLIDNTTRFDYLCWDLYARVGAWYEEDKSRLELRAQTLHALESGEGEIAATAELISTHIVKCHLDTMARLDISYNLLARESDILHLHFWSRAFELLKSSGAIHLENEGRNKGCWVMRAEGEDASSDAEREHDAEKIIVRSNGIVTYTGKDIAYHLWKLGKLGLEFRYKPFAEDHHGKQIWTTTSNEAEGVDPHPPFGNGTAFLNVIDVGQSYPQANVKRGVMEIDHDARVARSAHLAYEKVTLTPAAAVELGTELSESDSQKAQIGMSGRKGLGVKADDLIDRLEAGAFEEVRTRHTELAESEQRAIAHQIAVAALRYFLLKFTRTSVIAFDFKEALSFEGETGPYIQYSVVRANNIFRKLGKTPDEIRSQITSIDVEKINEFFASDGGDELWSLVTLAGRLDEVAESAATNFEPTQVAKYAFQLAKQFNLFYHNFHILSETDELRKTLLLLIADLVRRRLEAALCLLGIEAPERM